MRPMPGMSGAMDRVRPFLVLLGVGAIAAAIVVGVVRSDGAPARPTAFATQVNVGSQVVQLTATTERRVDGRPQLRVCAAAPADRARCLTPGEEIIDGREQVAVDARLDRAGDGSLFFGV